MDDMDLHGIIPYVSSLDLYHQWRLLSMDGDAIHR